MQSETIPPTPPHSRCHSPSQDCRKHEPLGKASSSLSGSSQALGDYGYLEINGGWVRPGSERSIYNACKGLSSKNCPEISELHLSSSPCILSEAQLSLEYTFFAMYVDDGEGDPRDSRISPDTFAKWAEGAVERGHAGHIDLIPEPVSGLLSQPLAE
jgi:hypothetical protein